MRVAPVAPVAPALLARWACLGVFVTILVGCADRGITAWRKDDPGGVYPAGEMSGEPTFGIGYRHRLYR